MPTMLAEPETRSRENELGHTITASITELMAFCPHCKTLETVWCTGNTLVQTRKFSQVGIRIYHDCGSMEPCRLYRTW